MIHNFGDFLHAEFKVALDVIY